jgi:hypothetical protein
MARFYRKTAPGVRNGQTCRKNNWRPSPSWYRDPQSRLVIDRRRPGDGYRHVLLKRDIDRFVNLVPNWAELVVGLDVIVLDRGGRGCDAWYDRGVVGLRAWPTNSRSEVGADWFREHCDFLTRIGARTEGDDPDDMVIHWTPGTVRAYQLCHLFLHELGHHRDRMQTRTKTDNGPRGQEFAEQYAWDFEFQIWESYLEEFGLTE